MSITLQPWKLKLLSVPKTFPTSITTCTHAIVKNIFFPQNRNTLFSFTQNAVELAIVADVEVIEKDFLSLGLEGVKVTEDVFCAFMVDDPDGIDNSGRRINELSAVLSRNGISIFYLSTYQTDFILVQEKRLKLVLPTIRSIFTLSVDSDCDLVSNASGPMSVGSFMESELGSSLPGANGGGGSFYGSSFFANHYGTTGNSTGGGTTAGTGPFPIPFSSSPRQHPFSHNTHTNGHNNNNYNNYSHGGSFLPSSYQSLGTSYGSNYSRPGTGISIPYGRHHGGGGGGRNSPSPTKPRRQNSDSGGSILDGVSLHMEPIERTAGHNNASHGHRQHHHQHHHHQGSLSQSNSGNTLNLQMTPTTPTNTTTTTTTRPAAIPTATTNTTRTPLTVGSTLDRADSNHSSSDSSSVSSHTQTTFGRYQKERQPSMTDSSYGDNSSLGGGIGGRYFPKQRYPHSSSMDSLMSNTMAGSIPMPLGTDRQPQPQQQYNPRTQRDGTGSSFGGGGATGAAEGAGGGGQPSSFSSVGLGHFVSLSLTTGPGGSESGNVNLQEQEAREAKIRKQIRENCQGLVLDDHLIMAGLSMDYEAQWAVTLLKVLFYADELAPPPPSNTISSTFSSSSSRSGPYGSQNNEHLENEQEEEEEEEEEEQEEEEYNSQRRLHNGLFRTKQIFENGNQSYFGSAGTHASSLSSPPPNGIDTANTTPRATTTTTRTKTTTKGNAKPLPKDTRTRFLSFTSTPEYTSLIADQQILAHFEDHMLNMSQTGECTLRCIQVNLSSFGIDTCGLVYSMSNPLVDADINLLCLSTFQTANILVSDTDLNQSLDILNLCR